MTSTERAYEGPTKLFLVFDVESIGLHGEGFAVGWVVIDYKGERHAEGLAACDPAKASGTSEGYQWVRENCPLLEVTHSGPRSLRTFFWQVWLDWKAEGAMLVADVAWPVEARFLADCVDDHRDRDWEGPYPLIDISSLRLAHGLGPLESAERLPDEEPEHSPLADARQSARLLIPLIRKRIEAEYEQVGWRYETKHGNGWSSDERIGIGWKPVYRKKGPTKKWVDILTLRSVGSAERDQLILEANLRGASMVQLGRTHGISRQRVFQILEALDPEGQRRKAVRAERAFIRDLQPLLRRAEKAKLCVVCQKFYAIANRNTCDKECSAAWQVRSVRMILDPRERDLHRTYQARSVLKHPDKHSVNRVRHSRRVLANKAKRRKAWYIPGSRASEIVRKLAPHRLPCKKEPKVPGPPVPPRVPGWEPKS